MMIEVECATVGDTAPCSACGHVKDPPKRLHEIACCGLGSHRVLFGPDWLRLRDLLAHLWRDTGEYSAVQRDGISEADALAWLERAHNGETPRRPHVEGEYLDFDDWGD